MQKCSADVMQYAHCSLWEMQVWLVRLKLTRTVHFTAQNTKKANISVGLDYLLKQNTKFQLPSGQDIEKMAYMLGVGLPVKSAAAFHTQR